MWCDFVTPPFIHTYGGTRAGKASTVFRHVSGNGSLLAPQTNATGWALANRVSIYHLWGWEEESSKRVDG